MTSSPNDQTDTSEPADEPGRIDDSQLPEDLRPESTDLLAGAGNSDAPSGEQRPDDDGSPDNDREHSGQISEPTTEMAPGDDPEVTEPTG
ncbi:MAG: hypothetical protein ACR2GB_01890 [Nocardioidaceae bacterium]